MSHNTLRFNAAMQRAFAKMSGDSNPAHLDAIAARRTIAGEPIVHGMHALLRALDAALPARFASKPIELAVHFRRPIMLNDPIALRRVGANTLALVDQGHQAITIAFSAGGHANNRQADQFRSTAFSRPTSKCRVRGLEQLADCAGAIRLPPARPLQQLLPRASKLLGVDAVRAFAAISHVVGMECPGRDSLLSSLQLQVKPRARANGLTWKVTRVDPRFRLVRIDIASGCVEGTVEAFLRPAPIQPPSWEEVAAHGIRSGEFAGQRALIVGGSRGLGAAVALIVAAGGGSSFVTYAIGKGDATDLRRSISRNSGHIQIARFDVEREKATALVHRAASFKPTHLYYFATPKIFAKRQQTFDRQLFDRFAAFYVSGFAALCTAVAGAAPDLRVFYPSTTAIDEGMVDAIEYVAAKSAGESACRLLETANAGVSILIKRLPRVATDQTASILQVAAANPIDAMLPIVRELHRPART
jgi:NAD(P)-dependent dehydrogenase (short-subunit alcohol dehydrogenase family)